MQDVRVRRSPSKCIHKGISEQVCDYKYFIFHHKNTLGIEIKRSRDQETYQDIITQSPIFLSWQDCTPLSAQLFLLVDLFARREAFLCEK